MRWQRGRWTGGERMDRKGVERMEERMEERRAD
jgi:hypothetical protein